MDPKNVRRLVRRGNWLDCKAGEVVAEEGSPEKRLIQLAKGPADVSLKGVHVTRFQAPAFTSEVAILTNLPAAATVKVSDQARI
ncbi:MAG: hypothetical protein AAGF78_02990 [Pseudomonadota bacterium]